jgi:hypothetical protein
MLSRTLPVPLSVTVAETTQESGSVKGRIRLSATGVSEVEPPVTLALEPDSVQVADQAMVASWASPAVSFALTETAAGSVIVCCSVQVALAPDALQKPAVFALAAVMPAVIPPMASKPVTTA